VANYYNPVIRLAEQVTGDDGKVRQAHRCVGSVNGAVCNLVWGSGALAIDCAIRNHRNRYVVEYTREHIIENTISLVELTFVRQALRRDGPRPLAPVQSSPPAALAPVPVLALADLKAQADALGFRLTRKPKAKAPAVVLEDDSIEL
jgi:hypothetical protein